MGYLRDKYMIIESNSKNVNFKSGVGSWVYNNVLPRWLILRAIVR